MNFSEWVDSGTTDVTGAIPDSELISTFKANAIFAILQKLGFSIRLVSSFFNVSYGTPDSSDRRNKDQFLDLSSLEMFLTILAVISDFVNESFIIPPFRALYGT